MTCIAAKIYDKTIEVAWDSCICDGIRTSTDMSKVLHLTNYTIGVSGPVRYMNVLAKYCKEEDPVTAIKDIDTLVESLKDLAKTSGVLQTKDGVDYASLQLLVIDTERKELYVVGPQFEYSTTSKSYAAVGSGREFALGALGVHQNVSPREALTVACEYDMYCKTPINTMTIGVQDAK